MMKLLLALSLIPFRVSAVTLCEVYGISDSPQSLSCTFQRQKIKLTCENGTYFLDGETVEMAFHMEVEEGPTPLVFRTKNGELTVTLSSSRSSEAVLSRQGKKLSGRCSL